MTQIIPSGLPIPTGLPINEEIGLLFQAARDEQTTRVRQYISSLG